MPIILDQVNETDSGTDIQVDPGLVYHRASAFSPRRNNSDFHRIHRIYSQQVSGEKQISYKVYPWKERIALSLTRPKPLNAPLPELLNSRHSTREFSEGGLNFDELSEVLRLSSGLKVYDGALASVPVRTRTVPSPGGAYSLEQYLVIRNVKGLQPGIYHYSAIEGCICRIADLPDDNELHLKAASDMISLPPVLFFITSVFQRNVEKYGARGFRLIYMEAGHLGQNLYLAATHLGLSGCYIGGGIDGYIQKLLGLDSFSEVFLSSFAMGRSAYQGAQHD